VSYKNPFANITISSSRRVWLVRTIINRKRRRNHRRA